MEEAGLINTRLVYKRDSIIHAGCGVGVWTG